MTELESQTKNKALMSQTGVLRIQVLPAGKLVQFRDAGYVRFWIPFQVNNLATVVDQDLASEMSPNNNDPSATFRQELAGIRLRYLKPYTFYWTR